MPHDDELEVHTPPRGRRAPRIEWYLAVVLALLIPGIVAIVWGSQTMRVVWAAGFLLVVIVLAIRMVRRPWK